MILSLIIIISPSLSLLYDKPHQGMALPECLHSDYMPSCLFACLLAFLPAYLPSCLPACLPACLLACLLTCLLSLELIFNVLLNKVTHAHTTS